MKASKPKLVIAGPGAGKTHGMVDEIISALSDLKPNRHMAIVTYTNSATNNIKKRLGDKIQIPPNVFIGTTHSFLNRYIVIPYSGLIHNDVNEELHFIQCGMDDVIDRMFGTKIDFKEKNFHKKRVTESMHKKGFVTFDQTLNLAEKCFENDRVKHLVANRIQYLFVDEFQDSDNKMFGIIENLRKQKCTTIYCVGDPEQYIQSFSTAKKAFKNIPILKASGKTTYDVTLNKTNRRSDGSIVNFINHFSKRTYNNETFEQSCYNEEAGEPVAFISQAADITLMMPQFFELCDKLNIENNDRAIIAKNKVVIKKASMALNNNVISPERSSKPSMLNEIKDTILTSLDMSQSVFCEGYGKTPFDLKVMAVKVARAIRNDTIINENTFASFIKNNFDLLINNEIPIKIDNLRQTVAPKSLKDAIMVSTIHKIKGLESEAVLAVAKNEKELNLWLETNTTTRDEHDDKPTSDFPRLGYVAFSRARKLLCIACVEVISEETKQKLRDLAVEII
tara:strand:- start:4688 stop:6211 length:1524 start_codon:yes stop_codon:yes gene_type:complete